MSYLTLNPNTEAIFSAEIGDLQIAGVIAEGFEDEPQLITLTTEEAIALKDWLIEVLPK